MRHVLTKSILGAVIDPYHDHRVNGTFADQPVRGFIDLPFDARKGRGRLKQILPVIEIENRVAAALVRNFIVSRGQPDPDKSSVTENLALELVEPQITGG